MLDASNPVDAKRIVAGYLAVVEAHASADDYPGSARDLPHSKALIGAAFRTSVQVLAVTGQLTAELREYLEIAYVSLADYRDDEEVRLLRDYRRAGEALAADQRLAREKTATDAWRQVAEQSRLAGQLALAINTEGERLRSEFRSWSGEMISAAAGGRQPSTAD